jgi:hypothetical protein
MAQLDTVLEARAPPLQAGHREDGQQGFRTWNVNGVIRRVPADFELPTKIPSKHLFLLYCAGDLDQGICPYRKLTTVDLIARKQQKRLSDMKALLQPIVDDLERKGHWNDRPTVEEAASMWSEAQSVIAVPEKTRGGIKRRHGEMAWTTHLNEYRKHRKVGEQLAQVTDDEIDNEEDLV